LLLEAAARGALLNVAINLSGISDASFADSMRAETAAIEAETSRLRAEVLSEVARRLVPANA
jgi:formiminotetrahydrofolate cyclodeaminase